MEPRSSSWMKPTFGPTPTCEANGYSRERQRWWTPPVPGGREGLLLLGSLSGDWGGGSHGNSWKQQCRDLHRLFTAAKSKLSWTSGSNLGQWTSPPRSSDSQLFDHSELVSAVGGLTGLQPRLQCRRSRLGLGQGRGHGQRMPRNKSQSPREYESILRRANSS